MIISGFDRLPQIKKALGVIHRHISTSELRTNWPAYVGSLGVKAHQRDDLILVQTTAKSIAHHYRITDTTFVVCFNESLDAAARVEVRNAREIFIEYRYTGSMYLADLMATMAHEIAHIYLHRLGLGFSDTFQDEVLTDTVAIYLGFGPYFLSAQREEVYQIAPDTKETTTKSIGYISADEMGYILAQRDFIRDENSDASITSNIGLNGYRTGKTEFSREQKQRPYTRRNTLNRAMFRLGWVLAKESEGIIFSCLFCKQPTRIPSLHKTVDVTCPHCNEKLRCFS